MTVEVWSILSIVAVLIVACIIIFIVKKTKESEHEPSYRAFFIIGIMWFPTGFATKNYALSIVGITFLIIGLTNKDKWKNEKKWSDLSSRDRNMKIMILIIALSIILAMSITAYVFLKI